eukprot:Platyproteum_vivax@DN11165_c0_g1_i2.p1
MEDPLHEVIDLSTNCEDRKKYALQLVEIIRLKSQYSEGVGLSVLWNELLNLYKEENNLSSIKEVDLPGLPKKNGASKLLAEFPYVFTLDDKQMVRLLTKDGQVQTNQQKRLGKTVEEMIQNTAASEERKKYALELVKICRFKMANEEFDDGVGLSILWNDLLSRFRENNDLSSTKDVRLPDLPKKNSAKKLLADFPHIFAVDDNQIVKVIEVSAQESETAVHYADNEFDSNKNKKKKKKKKVLCVDT